MPIRRPIFAAVLLLSCGLALAPTVAAQVLTWNDISGPVGFSSFHELADGTLYAINENVLYRSFDGGASWENFPRPGGEILEFAARGATTVLAIRRNAVNYKQYFISTDRGNTWTRFFHEANPVHHNLMLSADGTPHALFPAASKMAVERFVGAAWQRLGVPSGVYNFITGPPAYTVSALDDSGGIYIGTAADGIHSTRDNAQTWTRTLSYFQVASIAIGPGSRVAIGTTPNGRTAGGVFTTEDRGAVWTGPGLTDVYPAGLQFNAAGDIIVLGNRSGWNSTGIYRLDAGAPGWDSTGQFDFIYGTLHVMGSGKFLTSTPGLGLLVSTDDGASWHSDGIRKRDIYSVATAPDGAVLAGTIGSGLFRTTDSGFLWTGVSAPDQPYYFYVFTVAGARIYAGTEKGLCASDDNGLSWSLLTGALNPGTGEFPVYSVLRDAAGALFIGTGAGVFSSPDEGVTWIPAGLGESTIRAITMTTDGSLYAATGTEGVFSSTDAGISWTPRGLVRPDVQTIAVSDAGHVFVGVSSGLFVSTDGATTWERKIFTSGHVHSILFNGNFNLFAASSSGLFSSPDGGQSWTSAGLTGLFVISLAYDQFHTITAGIYKEGVARTSEIITGVQDGPVIPVTPALRGNYPNPFNPGTTIEYMVSSPSRVTLRVFDVLGRMSETLVSGVVQPGFHRAAWDASDHPSGVYFYSITVVPEFATRSRGSDLPYTETRKMLLMR